MIPLGSAKKNLVNFGSLTKKLQAWVLTHHKSTMHVLRMLMHLTSSHVTLLPGKFKPAELTPQSDLGHRADSRWALPQISIFFQREISEMRRPIGVKFCTVITTGPSLIMLIQNFWGATKILVAKTCKISTSKFGGEFFWNRWRYSKSDKYIFCIAIPPALGEKSSVNFGPLVTEIKRWNHTHSNWLFRKTIFRPLEGAAPSYFYTL